jgi:hypothetical protein
VPVVHLRQAQRVVDAHGLLDHDDEFRLWADRS